ncbi:MAG: ABC transporter ATP-binding protein [Oscillospiraceae bacterium]|jgi:simple sugar transport system ATP-binding protein|nr:ABC transporter ATP-binding protein [Oscillospiraceae bacterium]
MIEAPSVPRLQTINLTKSFGELRACDGVSVNVNAGEILALLGENGSGKTTLVNMVAGLYKPDGGEVRVSGAPVAIHSPTDARRYGIGMIHQHFKLVEVFTAIENICLGMPRESTRRGLMARTLAFIEKYGLGVPLDMKAYRMSVAQKQTVEILKALVRGADILILDEPTAVLTPQESEKLFDILRKMKEAGCAIIIITHKLAEVMELSDRVSILRAGRNVGEFATAKTNPRELTERMVGRKVDLSIERVHAQKRPLLTLEDVSYAHAGVKLLDGVSFDVSGGEILGVAGVAGSGQKQLCEAIAGLTGITSGSIRLLGEELAHLSPREIYDRGVRLGFIPEDRLGMGLVGSMDVTDNILLREYRTQRGGFIRRKPVRRKAMTLVSDLAVVPPDINRAVSQLSGGNLQKVLLGRELMQSPQLLVTSYVVRGLDVNSSYTIYDLLNDRKKNGVGALFIGEDLDVLLELCDRILVMCAGRVTGILDAKHATRAQIGLLMTGSEAV